MTGKDDIEGFSKLPNSLGNTNAYSNLIADGRFLNSIAISGIRGFGDSGGANQMDLMVEMLNI